MKRLWEKIKKAFTIDIVVSSTCKCGRQRKCGVRSGLCPITGIWHT